MQLTGYVLAAEPARASSMLSELKGHDVVAMVFAPGADDPSFAQAMQAMPPP